MIKTDKIKKMNIMIHLGARAFEEISGEMVQSVAFILEKNK